MAEPTDVLSQYPILQLALIFGTFVAGAIAVWRGLMAKPSAEHEANQDKAIDILQGIYRELQQQGRDNQRFANENNQKMDVGNELLRDIRERQTTRRST